MNIQDLIQLSNKIRNFPVYTKSEKKQIEEGKTSIKLSKGQPIYPMIFCKKRRIFAGDEYAPVRPMGIKRGDVYVPPFFRLKIIMAIIINYDPALIHGRISDHDFKLGMTYRFVNEYIGHMNAFDEAYKMVEMVIDNELYIIRREIGYYCYRQQMRKIYPSCFVSGAKFRCVRESETKFFLVSQEKANDAKRARTSFKTELMVKILNGKSVKSVTKMVKSNGKLKNGADKMKGDDARNGKVLFDKFNKALIRNGFKEAKKSSLYSYVKKMEEFLGMTLLELRLMADREMESILMGKHGETVSAVSSDVFDADLFLVEDS